MKEENLLSESMKFGKYQLIISISVILTIFYIPVIVITLPMMQKPPQFTIINTNITDIDNFCNNQYYNFNIDEMKDIIIINTSISNWSSDLNIVCHSKKIFSLVGTIYFLASIASYLSLSKFPDRYGRIRLYKYLNIFSFLALIQMLFLHNFGQLIIASFVCGISAINLVVSSVILNENINSKYTGLIIGIGMAMFPLGGLFNTIFMYVFEDWKIFFILVLISLGINNYLVIFYLKESPKWLLANNRQDEFYENLKFIFKFNNDKELYYQIQSSSMGKVTNSSINIRTYNYSIYDLFQYNSIRTNTLSSIYLWIVSGLSFYGLLLSLENFTGNIFLDSAVAYSAELLAEIGSGYIADRYGRQKTIFYSFIIASICGISVFVSNTILECIILFLSCIGISSAFNILYIYSAELYPTNVKSLAVSVFFVFNRLTASLVPYVLTIIPNITLIICILSLLAVIISKNMPETLNKVEGNEIEELKGFIYEDNYDNKSKSENTPLYNQFNNISY